MNHIKRRTLLKGALALSLVNISAKASTQINPLLQNQWPTIAFENQAASSTVNNLFGQQTISHSKQILINAPSIAENGTEVAVTISTEIKGVDSITIIVEKNTYPLAAQFSFYDSANPFVRTRLKFEKTSNVIAIVSARGNLYQAKRQVKVVVAGGCGG